MLVTCTIRRGDSRKLNRAVECDTDMQAGDDISGDDIAGDDISGE